jgi:hypothetical protein
MEDESSKYGESALGFWIGAHTWHLVNKKVPTKESSSTAHVVYSVPKIAHDTKLQLVSPFWATWSDVRDQIHQLHALLLSLSAFKSAIGLGAAIWLLWA